MAAKDEVVSTPYSQVSMTKEEFAICSRALGLYEKSVARAINNPDQLPAAKEAFRVSLHDIMALRSRFLRGFV